MASEAPGAKSPPGVRWRSVTVSLAWAVAVALAYLALLVAVGNTFTIENTSADLARAHHGRVLTALWGPLVVALALVPLRRRLRAPRLAAGFLATPALLCPLLVAVDRSGILGLLLLFVAAPVVVAGLVLGVLPAPAKRPPGPERRPAVLIVVAGCALVTLVLLVLSLVSVLGG